ncbi:lactate/malate dehydrogenase [Globomyces pollinis-pini]|nr:lactate/malate dehydrogenase [Globomyces pollinis-pini]
MVKVAVLGAAGGIGQPLSLLIKSNTLVTDLALFDIVNTPGVAADLSHINTPAKVVGYVGDDQLADALTGCHIVVIPAGVPRKPGMTRDDLFNINAGIVRNLALAMTKHCPKAFIAVISNPVNSTVPIVAEVFKKAGVYDPKRLFGVTTLDLVRASTFVSEIKGKSPLETHVNVIGGHSGATIIPILSSLGLSFTDAERDTLVQRIQFGGDEVVKAKNGAGSATLSMAFAGARFVNSLLEASVLKKSGVTECTYIDTDVAEGLSFFSTVVELGVNGVENARPLPPLSEHEQKLYAAAVPDLQNSIKKGIEFVAKASL